MSGVCLKFTVGTPGTAATRTLYDTKLRATGGEHARVWTENIPEYVDPPELDISYTERRANLVEYARQCEEDELMRGHEGSGMTRTYYRAIFCFHKEVSDEKAIEMISKHLEENFPLSPSIGALHRNAKHMHGHVIIFARQIDDHKLQLGWKTFRSLDESWAKDYGREFGEHFEIEHLRKKEERRLHRSVARAATERGEAPPPRPERVAAERNQVKEKIEMEKRERGIYTNDTTGTRRDQRSIASANPEFGVGIKQPISDIGSRRRKQAPVDGAADISRISSGIREELRATQTGRTPVLRGDDRGAGRSEEIQIAEQPVGNRSEQSTQPNPRSVRQSSEHDRTNLPLRDSDLRNHGDSDAAAISARERLIEEQLAHGRLVAMNTRKIPLAESRGMVPIIPTTPEKTEEKPKEKSYDRGR